MEVLGQPVRDNPEIYRVLGMMSEHEAVYPFYSGRQFVQLAAQLHGLDDRRCRGGQGDPVRGTLGRTGPRPRHVLPGNEAAHEAGCRPRARSRGDDPRRSP